MMDSTAFTSVFYVWFGVFLFFAGVCIGFLCMFDKLLNTLIASTRDVRYELQDVNRRLHDVLRAMPSRTRTVDVQLQAKQEMFQKTIKQVIGELRNIAKDWLV